jgi:hypothetical protein
MEERRQKAMGARLQRFIPGRNLETDGRRGPVSH